MTYRFSIARRPALLAALSFALALMLSAIFGAGARSQTESDQPPPRSVWDLAKSYPDCVRFTDSCRTCVRLTDGKVGCSLPGIACQPGAWSCADAEGKIFPSKAAP